MDDGERRVKVSVVVDCSEMQGIEGDLVEIEDEGLAELVDQGVVWLVKVGSQRTVPTRRKKFYRETASWVGGGPGPPRTPDRAV